MPKAFINESNAKYQRLFKLYKQAYPDKRGDAVTDEVVKIWRDTLEKGKNEERTRRNKKETNCCAILEESFFLTKSIDCLQQQPTIPLKKKSEKEK